MWHFCRWRSRWILDGPFHNRDVDSVGLFRSLTLIDVKLHGVSLEGEVAKVAVVGVKRYLQVGEAVQAVQDAASGIAGRLSTILKFGQLESESRVSKWL